MNKTTTVSALFLAGAMLLSCCPSVVHAEDETKNEAREKVVLGTGATLILIGIAPVVAGWIMLYSRKSEKEFKTRYSPEQTRKVSKMFTKDYAKNLWYFISDEVIGQRKQSSALKVRPDHKIYPGEETPAYGLLGTIDAYAAPFAESATKFTAPFLGAHVLWGYLKTFAYKATGEKEPKKVDHTEALVEATNAQTVELRAQNANLQAILRQMVAERAAAAEPAPAPQA